MNRNRNGISYILKNWKDFFFLRNMIVYKIASLIYRKNNGMFILDEDWDNLIILDACRYDFFKEEIEKRQIDGYLKKVISRGSHTLNFLKENFTEDYYNDIVYITANPHVDVLLKGKLYKLISVWKNGWSEKYRTVLPEIMFDYAIDAHFRFPNKKLIIHLMQPHYPYIGYKTDYFSLLDNYTFRALRTRVVSKSPIKTKRKYKDKLFSLYTNDIFAIVKKDSILRAYKKNLKLAMSVIEKLVKILLGKTIITSDHGDALGEFIHPLIPIRFYGHSNRIRLPILVDVPWFIVEQKNNQSHLDKELREKKQIIKAIDDLKTTF